MKDLYMKNFNGDKIFSLEYDKETLRDMIIDKQQEIERLQTIINEIKAIIYNNQIIGIEERLNIQEILDKDNK